VSGTRHGLGTCLLLALALLPIGGIGHAEPATGLTATRRLVARLAASGRAEAKVTVTRPDPLGGAATVQRGTLALEPPDRVRLDFPASGERLAVHGDGGEWVQPAVRQMVRIRRDQVALAAWLWDVFLHGGSDRFVERSTGARQFVLAPRESHSGLPDHVTLRLDSHGLPAALEIDDQTGDGASYRFGGWRFKRARGDSAFVLRAPPGYAVVDLP
jgi:hypothetical protein